MDNNAPQGMITVAEAARRLGRSIEQVRRYLREGKLPGRRLGQQWFIPVEALMRYRFGGGLFQRIKEPSAVMEMDKRVINKELEALIKRIDDNREAIRRRLGHDLDVVELLRRSRQEH